MQAVPAGLYLLLCAALCVGCSGRADTNALTPSTARATGTRSFDVLLIFVRDWEAGEDVELGLIRDRRTGRSTITLIREERVGRPRIVLDSIASGEKGADAVLAKLDSFDIWAMNAPNAPGAACRTVNGQRRCAITAQDYSLVMQVERGRRVRVQRYTHLERLASSRQVRALGDFILTWAREREAGMRRR